MSDKKLLNNSAIVRAKQNIRGTINREIQNGIPISVISLIVDSCADEIDVLLKQVLADEDLQNQQGEPEEVECPEQELVE